MSFTELSKVNPLAELEILDVLPTSCCELHHQHSCNFWVLIKLPTGIHTRSSQVNECCLSFNVQAAERVFVTEKSLQSTISINEKSGISRKIGKFGKSDSGEVCFWGTGILSDLGFSLFFFYFSFTYNARRKERKRFKNLIKSWARRAENRNSKISFQQVRPTSKSFDVGSNDDIG